MRFSYEYKNQREAEILKNALLRGRLTHAYLLVGRETGEKNKIIDEIARGLFSKTSQDHLSFYENGSHPDYLRIKPVDGAIRVDEVQIIASFLSSSPNYAEKRIVVIDEADTMNSYAMNKILKLIEEPPSYALFFLLTEVPEKLIDTLKSRLTKLEFTILAEEAGSTETAELKLAKELLHQVKNKDYEGCYESLTLINNKDTDKALFLNALELAVVEACESEAKLEDLKKYNLMADYISGYRYRLLTNQKADLLITSLVSEFLELYK